MSFKKRSLIKIFLRHCSRETAARHYRKAYLATIASFGVMPVVTTVTEKLTGFGGSPRILATKAAFYSAVYVTNWVVAAGLLLYARAGQKHYNKTQKSRQPH